MAPTNRDERIRHEIEVELRWVPAIEPGAVAARVEEGVVRLTGHVTDPSTRRAAEELARRVPGVCLVVNEVEVVRDNDAIRDASLVRAVANTFGHGRPEPH